MSKTVYLAGPITGLSYGETTNWRDEFSTRLKRAGIKGIDPLRGKSYLKEMTSMPHTYDHPMSTSRGIMARDHYDCKNSDMVVANFLGAEKVSIGTCMEVAWAHAYGNPLILIMEEDNNIHDHPMIREAAAYRVTTVEEAAHLAIALLKPYAS